MSEMGYIRALAEQLELLRGRIADLERADRPRLNRGTAFPTGWAVGVPFFRTDLGWWCRYDGTRWTTTQEFVAIIPPVNGATGSGLGGHSELRQDYAPLITRVSLSRFVATTNNGSNFWSIFVRGANAAYGSTTTITTVTTAASAANTWVSSDAAPTGAAVPSFDRARIDVLVQTTGSPGALTSNITVYYRLIIP